MKIIVTLIVMFLSFSNVHADNWSKILAKELQLFYPGQSSWEWLLTKHKGAKSVRKGASCMECHEGEEKEMGETLVSGKKLENSPIKNKPGSMKVKLKTYYDSKKMYVWLQWHENEFSSNKKMDKDFQTKITLMLGDERVREFPVGGCWGVCHDDATNMRSFKGNKERNLYTSKSRIKIKRTGGGDNLVDEDELSEMLENGNILEYWQIALESADKHKINHGYILEKRHQQDKVSVEGKVSFNQGMWTVEMSRNLTEDQKGKLNIKEDHLYTIGIAIHDDFSKGRFHYISLPRSFALNDSDADISVNKK